MERAQGVKSMKKFGVLAASLGLALALAQPVPASAAIQTIEASGVYVMDSRLGETTEAATARAREDAKRAAAEKAGVYVESYSKMVNMVLEEDEVRTIAAQVLKIQGEKSKVAVLEDSLLQFTVTITALVDDNGPAMQEAMSADRGTLAESTRRNNELQKAYDELKQQMEDLKRQYASASDAQRQEIKAEAARNTERLGAVEELEKANACYLRRNYGQALTSYSNAIRMDSRLYEAYNGRGLTYYYMRRLNEAVNDFSQAIALKSDFANAYNNRGMAYGAAGQYQNAAQDLQTAARLMPNSAEIHSNLGSVYLSLQNYDAAIGECSKAIQLNPDYTEAYFNRSLAYGHQGRYVDALPDAKRAQDLSPGDKSIQDWYQRVRNKVGG